MRCTWVTKALLLSGLVFFSNLPRLWAHDSCGAIDLRREVGPPRDQGETGWCYAHTAADLISVHQRVRVSAFDLAMAFTFYPSTVFSPQDQRLQAFRKRNPGGLLRWNNAFLDQADQLTPGQAECFATGVYQFGGYDEAAVLVGHVRGLCADAKLPRTAAEIRQAAEFLRTQLIANLRAQDLGEVVVSEIFRLAAERWMSERCGDRLRPPLHMIPSSIYVSSDLAQFLARYSNANSRRRVQAPLFRQIDRMLSLRRVITIGYSAYDLLEKEPEAGPMRQRRFPFHPRHQRVLRSRALEACESGAVSADHEPEEDLGDHASVIVARKRIKGICHYFVRNSFGADCSGYRAKFSDKCEARHGGAWVTKEDLKSLYSVVWLF